MQTKTYLFDQEQWKQKLKDLFVSHKAELDSFGTRVNQTFEAAVFAKTIQWHKNNGWRVDIRNPKKKNQYIFKLKFSTRGAPGGYTHVLCEKENELIEIRHQLRAKIYHQPSWGVEANICCDIAIIKIVENLNKMPSDFAIENEDLISFGEAKHMSAYPELIASFVGLVHELRPECLDNIRNNTDFKQSNTVAPFLYLSGYLSGTADAMQTSITERGYNVDIYHINNELCIIK
jgi:hypothetical protein